MDWMWNAMWARVGWALGELLWLVIVLVMIVIALLVYCTYLGIKQRRCAHAKMAQLPSSPARRCSDCGLVVWPGRVEADKGCRS